jgi:hypothetical protein
MPDSSITAAQPASAHAYTGRIVTIASLVVGLIGAAAPVVLNLDLTSTAGIVAGIVALSAVIVKYLDGWQQYEARLDGAAAVSPAATGPAPAPDAPAPAAPAPVNGTAAAATDPASALEPVDPAEPDAPLPGEADATAGVAPDDEPDDVPQAPTDDEIAAELPLLEGQTTGETGNGQGGRLTHA